MERLSSMGDKGNSANPGQTDIAARLLAGDRRALARVVTLIENGAPEARAILTRLHAHGGHAHIVGFTGSPGAGKSTLVMQLARELRRRDSGRPHPHARVGRRPQRLYPQHG